MINCSKCGEENPESAEFCEYCGAILAKSLNSNVDINLPITGNEVKSNDSTPTIVTVLLLIFVFPIGVIVMWFWPKWKVWVKLLITLIAIIPIFFMGSPINVHGPNASQAAGANVSSITTGYAMNIDGFLSSPKFWRIRD